MTTENDGADPSSGRVIPMRAAGLGVVGASPDKAGPDTGFFIRRGSGRLRALGPRLRPLQLTGDRGFPPNSTPPPRIAAVLA